MRIVFALMIFLAHSPCIAQTLMSNADALAMIGRLEADPMNDNAKSEMEAIFQWLDKTDSAIVMIADAEMNAIFKRRVPYNRGLYILLLGGMARFDLEHPETNIEDPALDREAGYKCMCTGYHNTLCIHKFKRDKFFHKLCKPYAP